MLNDILGGRVDELHGLVMKLLERIAYASCTQRPLDEDLPVAKAVALEQYDAPSGRSKESVARRH